MAQEDHENDYLTVRELMRLEAEQARDAMRARRSGSNPDFHSSRGAGQAQASAGDASPRLAGIYGVGQRLFAEVRTASRAWLFLKGQSLPLGHDERSAEFRLKDLSGSCVRLERNGDELALCLPMGGSS